MNRVEKVAEEIRKEMGRILREELRDPRLGFVTITRVVMTPDLRFARIFFSVYGDERQWQETEAALASASGFIRRLLGEHLDLRFVPEVAFASDHSSEYSIQIETRLQEIGLGQEETPVPKTKARRGSKKTAGRNQKKRQ